MKSGVMRLRGAVWGVVWLAVGLLGIFPGCRQYDPGYSEPMVNGYLYRGEYYNYTVEYERYVEVFDPKGLRMVPVVRLNNEELKPYYYTWTKYGYGDTFHFAVNQPYTLEVEHYYGKANARVTMPDNFTIVSPPENYILDLDSTLDIRWTRSAGAEWYWVEIDLDYDYRDTLGEDENRSLRLDTMLQDTWLVLPPERLFPGDVSDIVEGDASVMIWSGNGPAIEPGDRSNITGTGFGFFNAINEPREKYFYVGAPVAIRRCSDGAAIRSRFFQRLKARFR